MYKLLKFFRIDFNTIIVEDNIVIHFIYIVQLSDLCRIDRLFAQIGMDNSCAIFISITFFILITLCERVTKILAYRKKN